MLEFEIKLQIGGQIIILYASAKYTRAVFFFQCLSEIVTNSKIIGDIYFGSTRLFVFDRCSAGMFQV